jgi:hypothetical protein
VNDGAGVEGYVSLAGYYGQLYALMLPSIYLSLLTLQLFDHMLSYKLQRRVLKDIVL